MKGENREEARTNTEERLVKQPEGLGANDRP